MRRIRKFLKKLWPDKSAISSVEYVLLLALVASGIIAGATLLGNTIGVEMNETATCISSDGTNCT